MSAPSSDRPSRQPLAGQLVAFTGKLSSLGRKDASVLVGRLGGTVTDEVTTKTTMLVVGDEGFGPPAQSEASLEDTVGASPQREKSNKLRRAERLNAQQENAIRILSESDFCRLVGVPTPDAVKRQYYAMRDVLARYRMVREDQLRYLVKCGLIRPEFRNNADTFLAFPDLATIKQANDELERGVSFRSVVRSLMASRHGQLAFDFRLDAAPARVLELRRAPAAKPESRPSERAVSPSDKDLAEEYFRAASLLDNGDEVKKDDAAAAYRKALEADPSLVAALINLANIHYSRDELAEAQALYERAIGLEGDFFEAHFNLGNIYHDLGRFAEAQACYREALRLNPTYADGHFYLAVTLEKMGLSQEARPHWRAYRRLAPNGEWVELAKEFSE